MTQIIKKIINKKKVYIVEEHHHVLLPWASEREQLGIAPHVLTLDHHTDTLPEYTHYDETHETPHEKRIDRRDPRQIEAALKDLRHDEHFDFAIRNDIISSATIFSHVNFSRDVNPRITIIHDPPPDEERKTLEHYYSRALETEFLENNLKHAPLPERPCILDIDLDYFKGEKSIHPQNSSLFMELIQKSAVITISREQDWVRLLNMDFGNRLSGYFEEGILQMISGGSCKNR